MDAEIQRSLGRIEGTLEALVLAFKSHVELSEINTRRFEEHLQQPHNGRAPLNRELIVRIGLPAAAIGGSLGTIILEILNKLLR